MDMNFTSSACEYDVNCLSVMRTNFVFSALLGSPPVVAHVPFAKET